MPTFRCDLAQTGESDSLSAEQVGALHAASELTPEPLAWNRDARGPLVVELDLPTHAVAALPFAFDA